MTRVLIALAMSTIVLGVAATPASAAGFRDVSPNGSDVGNDCSDQNNPCATIQHAINEAEPDDWISVAPGNYDENVKIDQPLVLHGPDINAEADGPQAVVDGGSGTGIDIESAGVTVEEMTVTAGPTGTAIRTSGSNIDHLRVQLNIISGGSSGVSLEAGGEDDSVGFNRISGVEDGIRVSGADYTDLEIGANHFDASISDDAIRAASATTIEGFDLWENELRAPSRIASHLTRSQFQEADIGYNTFSSADGPQLALHGTGVRVMSNSFEGSGAAGCLQILGNQGGLPPSENILVSLDNEFIDCDPYGIQLGPEVEKMVIFGNEFPGSYDGVATSNASPWNVTGRVEIKDNRLVDTTHLAIDNLASGTLDAEQNWWGCNNGAGAPGCDGVSGGVYAGNNLKLTAPIGPRKPETGIEELPTGSSITLNPGEQAEVSALLAASGSSLITGVPTEKSPVHFSSSLGRLSPATNYISDGWATSLFTAGATPGEGFITVSMDNQQTLVPVTIRGGTAQSTPSTIPPPAALTPTPAAPTMHLGGKGGPLAGRRAVVGSVSCADSCRVTSSKVQILVGGHRYRGTLTPHAVAAGSTALIRVTLSPRALRALKKDKRARILTKVTVTNAAGESTTRTVSAALSVPD